MIPLSLLGSYLRARRGAALAMVLALGAAASASAQTNSGETPAGAAGPPAVRAQLPAAPSVSPTSDRPKADADAIKQRDQELDATRQKERESAESQAKLRREMESLAADRSALNKQLIDTATRVRDLEASIEATQARLKPLDEQEAVLRKSLDERRVAVVEILAVLQRVGHQPPPVLFVEPEDALQAVRTAITLGGMVPGMRAEADALAGDLADLTKIRKGIIGEHERIARDLDVLGRDQLRLNLLIDERQKKETASSEALEAERVRAADLARQADSLKSLIAKLESGLPAANRAARAVEEDATRPNLAALNDPGRLTPAVAFAATRGRLRWPVNGVKVSDFGTSDGLGGTQKGLSIGSRANAQITSPCDGWVVYAGTFRSYGQLLILNAGGGYHVLLAGMERISVDLGQFVLTGEPVAVMGGGAQVSAAATKSKQPVLYVEFRKDGTPIDPSPWWATNEGEKVRG
jgi:septal ring factor EnvC (AmiA/AmiB activator)